MLVEQNEASVPKCEDFVSRCSFDHPVSERKLIQTHLSCVILTGPFAYKIKKPVDLGFVDYSTLEKRKHFCQQEVELNRRYARDMYVGVVPVIRRQDGVYIGDSEQVESASQVIDYAVKMRQFRQQDLVASALTDHRVTSQSVHEFGCRLAQFHGGTESALPDADYVQPERIVAAAVSNFEVLLAELTDEDRFGNLQRLARWTKQEFSQLRDRFVDRLHSGHVKKGHGDLHLKNVVMLEGQLHAFDGIEFNDEFQFIDVFSELAFPVMDFMARGYHGLGWRMLNAYLEESGEYLDLHLLRFYLVYRAMVRAKVAWLNPVNHTEERRSQYASRLNPEDPNAGPWDKYIRTATYFAFELRPRLTITHGFSGSGKSTAAMNLIEQSGGVRIRSDALRLRLADNFGSLDKYSTGMSDRVYANLLEICNEGLLAGFPMVADATFLKRHRRSTFEQLASTHGIDFEILDCQAPLAELESRLESRRNDLSEADAEVLRQQMENHDPLTQSEMNCVNQKIKPNDQQS